MLDSSFAAIVPMVCVTLAALAAMVAESFRGKGEDMPIGGLGVIGLGFALAGCVLLWGRNQSSFGTIHADNFGLFVSITICIVGLLTIAFSGQVIPSSVERFTVILSLPEVLSGLENHSALFHPSKLPMHTGSRNALRSVG